MKKRQPVKLEQIELLQEFVTGGVNAQRTVDKIIDDYERAGVIAPRDETDRRLRNLRASRRRRGRADPD